MRSKFVVCQAPKPAPRSKRKRREFIGGPCGRRVPRKMTDQYYLRGVLPQLLRPRMAEVGIEPAAKRRCERPGCNTIPK